MTDQTLRLRQVHPAFVHDGRPSSQAFRPTPKDQRKLSVYDGDLITAEHAWKHFTDRGFQSAGVLAVSVDDCSKESLAVRSSPEHFPEHAEIDFQEFSDNQIARISKRLTAVAVDRGWQYQA